MNLRHELCIYLDTLTITGDNIGDIRRQCFVPWNSAWNGIVRDETAARERAAEPPVPFAPIPVRVDSTLCEPGEVWIERPDGTAARIWPDAAIQPTAEAE